jgi:hypothetical protein
MKRSIKLLACLLALFFSFPVAGATHATHKANVMSMCRNGKTDVAIVLDSSITTTAKIAAGDIANDFKESTSFKPAIANALPAKSFIILPVNLSQDNKFFNRLKSRHDIDVKSLQGKWESYKIIPVKDGFKKGQDVLLVAGSDARGTMYGLYKVSEKVLGTDPQKLWTDAIPVKVKNPQWKYGTVEKGEPTFKYRGWFVNDENYLLSWKGPDKDDMRIEPEVWAQIFETICRLGGNFYTITEYGWSPDSTTLQLANDRGLYVMGSHMHMLISNTSFEWFPWTKEKYGKELPYDWSSNKKEMTAFWEEAVKKYRNYLAIWPVGLKSWNDRDFRDTDPGAPKTVEGRTEFTNEAIAAQEKLLKDNLDPSKGKPICTFVMRGDPVDQIHTGKLKFPDNTIVLWPDNPSFGMMGEVPTKEDFARNPYHGIFFHLTYCDNQWVQWTPLKQVQHELMKAVNAKATSMAEFNVGDIRELPMKIAMAMNFTSNARPWQNNTDYWKTFTTDWCRKQYNPTNLNKIVSLYEKYWEKEMPLRSTIVVECLSHYTVLPGNLFDAIKGKQDVSKAVIDYISAINLPSGDRFGKMGLPYLKESSAGWDSLYTQALKAMPTVAKQRQQFYFDSYVLQVQTSRLVNHWGTDMLTAFDAIRSSHFKEAAASLRQATTWLKELKVERDKSQHGKWQNWFRGEENPSWINSFWGFHIDREISFDNQLADLLLSLDN